MDLENQFLSISIFKSCQATEANPDQKKEQNLLISEAGCLWGSNDDPMLFERRPQGRTLRTRYKFMEDRN